MTRSSVTVRLDREKKLKYELDAASREMTLSDYLRDRMDRADISDELIAIRIAMEGIGGSRTTVSSSLSDAAWLEVLLLLRSNATPQTMTKNHQILRQMGREPIIM